jgi:hypothetical protein
VGTSGTAATRFAAPTASILILPERTCGSTWVTEVNNMGMFPAITSTIAGPPPLYGTIAMSMPATFLNSSPPKWLNPPTPVDAYWRAPGFARARSTRSRSVFNPDPG